MAVVIFCTAKQEKNKEMNGSGAMRGKEYIIPVAENIETINPNL